MNTMQVMEAFARGQSGKANSVYSEGDEVYSYGSHFPMAVRRNGTLYVNKDKYSVTTSKHQSYLRRALTGQEYIEMSTEQLKELIRNS